MRFLTLLNNGCTVKTATTKFVDELLQHSNSKGELCLELSADFVNECLNAIGLKFKTITAEELELGDEYSWPEEWRIFTFNYNSFLFMRFEQFLVGLCEIVHERQQEHIAVRQYAKVVSVTDEEEPDADEIETPVDYLMQLVAIWCSVYKTLERLKLSETENPFEEPLARINFHLLYGMHRVRKFYRTEFYLLDAICNRLYYSAVQGIFYEEAHVTITTGLLEIFEDDFDLFYLHAADTLNFYFLAFSVTHHRRSYINVFKCLKQMLQRQVTAVGRGENNENLPNKHLILTNFLISGRMQEVYCHTLKWENSKNLLLAVLEFLKILQSKLLDLDCFSQDFVESILTHVLHSDEQISALATELFIVMIRRKLSDDKVLKCILECYLNRMNSPVLLTLYVKRLWLHLPYMQSIDVYLEILKNPKTNEFMRLLAAHFLVAVYKQMLLNLEKYHLRIAYILEILPEVLESLKINNINGIILQIFAAADFELLKNYVQSFDMILINFENYAVSELAHGNHLEYPLLLNLFMQLHRCLKETQNWHKLEECSLYIFRRYQSIEKSLKNLARSPKIELLTDFNNVLLRLNIILKIDYDILDSIYELFNTLRIHLLDTQQINEFVLKTNLLIDVYAIEIITACIIKLYTTVDISKEKKIEIAAYAKQLETYLLQILCNEELSKVPVVRIKTIFNSLISLYCNCNATTDQSTKTAILKLELRSYHLLVQTLILINFESTILFHNDYMEKTQIHPARTFEYQKLMFYKFTQLHACGEHVQIPSNISWKVCIYYGLPSHKFNKELVTFLVTLATHHLPIYRHIAAVSIYNLHKRKPALKDYTILNAIKVHKTLIDKQLPVSAPQILNVHIVLSVLQIIEQSVKILKINTNLNRLAALKHLNTFIENINLGAEKNNVLQNILSQANALENYLLTAVEKKCLKTYLSYYDKYTRKNASTTK